MPLPPSNFDPYPTFRTHHEQDRIDSSAVFVDEDSIHLWKGHSKALREIHTVIILIVDDNAAIRRLIRHTLSDSNHEIHECHDGDEALRIYSEISPDLTFMDIRMPRMDGLTATRKIIAEHPEARIVIVTDYDVSEIRAAAFAAGAKGYVLKDNLSDIETVINELLIT